MTTSAQVVDAVDHARVAQALWARSTFPERAACVERMRTFVSAHKHDIARAIAAASGKTVQEALTTEILPSLVMTKWLAANARRVLQPASEAPFHWLWRLRKRPATTVYTPLGVVGLLAPSWQYPFAMPFVELAAAFLAGNAVILNLPLQMVTVGSWIDDAVAAASLPSRHLFAHVVGPGSTIATILSSQRVPRFFLTGSVPVEAMWTHVDAMHGDGVEAITPFALELGMRSCAIVLPDANLERAAQCIAWAGYQNAGMSCTGVQRVFVHRDVASAFARRLCAITSSLTHGPDPDAASAHQQQHHHHHASHPRSRGARASSVSSNLDAAATATPNPPKPHIGALASLDEAETAKAALETAVASGARVAAQSREVGDCTQGFFVPATVLLDVPTDSALITGESIAAPFIPVVPFDAVGDGDDDDELDDLVNRQAQAITASIFTRTPAVARALARRLDCRVVTVNDASFAPGPPEAPWGGWREFGQRRVFGPIGLKEFSREQSVEEPRMHPALEANSSVWWYNGDQREVVEGTAALIELNAPTGLRPWFAAVWILLLLILRRIRMGILRSLRRCREIAAAPLQAVQSARAYLPASLGGARSPPVAAAPPPRGVTFAADGPAKSKEL